MGVQMFKKMMVIDSAIRTGAVQVTTSQLARLKIVFGIFMVVFLSSCGKQEFNLPVGDIEAGRATFVLLQCTDCHSVDGLEYTGAGEINVHLGGKTTKVKSYADLVTSVIHPSHKLSRGDDKRTFTEEGVSKMRHYNEFMTVDELVNVVTFLETKYEIWIPVDYRYPDY